MSKLSRVIPPLSKPSLTQYTTSTRNSGRLPTIPSRKPQTASFTQISRLNNRQDPKSQRPDSEPEGSNPSYPAFKFSDLGANRAVKYTVYTVLGVLGTMETIFYTKALWRYFSPPPPSSSPDSPEAEKE